ncbi:MAG: transcriptional regulator [Acidobacteria bacterium]|nr:MAG: transcriptional regulator [Acidobacteriota bacterium]
MPLYEYECDACRHRFERIQKFSDPLEDTCPTCGGRVRKLMSSPAIQFKGSGFYITDYATKEHSAAAKADSAPAEQADKAGTSGKSDTSEKTQKPEKAEKARGAEKPGKGDAPAKTARGAASTDSGHSTSSSSPASPGGTPSKS